MTDFPSRVKLENFHNMDMDRFRLSLNLPKFYVTPSGEIVAWLTKKEVITLNDNCTASLLDDDRISSASVLES